MKMLNLSKIIQAFKTNDTLRYGVPMMLLVVGGSFGLREFTQIRYDSQKLKSTVDPELVKQLKSKEKETTLESEYEKIKDKQFDDWVNIRGPRPWEDSKSFQEQQRTNMSAKS
ncbi:cytochrome c oxidase assembly protein COX16 homolog, mitochondrial isoform X2 [Hyperolius riggenbachi]|uniref:cytochrome c oxidase assembly protein COX16 homolog, mitochondrial isoform X2 n=1 Tax=Hyperolius riggenbachi TaxID=752182 RepID=UPI0035A37D9B